VDRAIFASEVFWQALSLDWNLPDYSEAAPTVAHPPYELHVELGELAAVPSLSPNLTTSQLRDVVARNSLILAFMPMNAAAYRQRGLAQAALRSFKEAVADYSMALLLSGADERIRVDLLRRRAANYLSLGEHNRMMSDIREIDRLAPAQGRKLRASLADWLVQFSARQREKPATELAYLRKAVEVDPNHELAYNNLAWLLVTGPAELRNPAEALPLARRALEHSLDEANTLNTLGVVLYRNGQFAEAITILERSLAAGDGSTDGFDLFFLSMCHAKQGNASRAREIFDRAVAWCDKQKNLSPAWAKELGDFRAEAGALIGDVKTN
jgi:tetratricopeptide (TPR) repeat protein